MSISNPKASDGYRTVHKDLSVSGVVLAAAAGQAAAITAPSASFTVFVQKVYVTITTSAAQTITVRDSAGTPIVIAGIPASAAVGTTYTFDFGARGFALTEGKNLDIAGTAGPAYSYSIEAYAKQTTAIAASTVDRIF